MAFSSFKRVFFKPHLKKARRQKSIRFPPSVQEIQDQNGLLDLSYRPPYNLDTPLLALFRLYVALVSGQYLWLRTEVERFWNRHDWKVSEIPDPCDHADPIRYAILATIPYLLIRAFNANIDLGLPRDAPAIWTEEDRREFTARPKKFESIPTWASEVPALDTPLLLPDAEGRLPSDVSDPKADPDMRRKNILTVRQPVAFI